MGMRGGFREDILDDAFRQFSGSLILFLHNHNPRSRFDIRPEYFAHNDNSLCQLKVYFKDAEASSEKSRGNYHS